MPKGGLLDVRFRDMDSARVYKMLEQEQDDDDGGQGSIDDHDWDGAEEMSQEEAKALERDIDEAIRQGALTAGKLGSGGDRMFEDLLQTKVDWREVLREFIATTCQGNDYSTWRRPNRRFVSSGYYMPSGVSESVDELVIAADMSGSMTSALPRLFAEIKGICEHVKPKVVRLLYWDTKVCADEKYVEDEVANIVKSTKPKGGGGTSVGCVSAYMAENGIKPQAVIVLTDGYLGGDWGTWSCPVLWCIVDNKRAVPGVGKYVHVEN
jgi:predicted metal-dependent peptidase